VSVGGDAFSFKVLGGLPSLRQGHGD